MGDTARDRWLAGLCPCCGEDIGPGRRHDPLWIGEGVQVCGTCTPHADAEVVELLLRLVVTGEDV